MAARRKVTRKMAKQRTITIDVRLKPFRFPNFVSADGIKAGYGEAGAVLKIAVGSLTDEQAAQYWDDLKPLWLAHVAKERMKQDDG